MKFLGFLLGLLLLVSSASAQVTGTVGAQAAENIFPLVIPACTTTGYSISATTTLPAGFNVGLTIAVDDLAGLVYALTDDISGAGTIRLAVLDTATLTLQDTLILPDQAQVTGSTGELVADDENGRAYMFYRVRVASGACTGTGGFTCLGSRTFNGATQESGIVYASQVNTNLDNISLDQTNDVVYLTIADFNCNAAGNQRCIESATTPTLSLTALGQSLATMNPGGNYGPAVNNGTNIFALGNLTDEVGRYDIPNGGGETVISLSTGGRNALSMGGPGGGAVPSVQVGTDDSVGGTAFLSQVRLSDFTNNATTVFGASDGSTWTQGGIFYDEQNDEWHVAMTADLTAIARVSNPVGTVLERYTFATCSVENGGVSCATGATNDAAYSPRQAALFFVNGFSPATVYKVDVCATGGP